MSLGLTQQSLRSWHRVPMIMSDVIRNEHKLQLLEPLVNFSQPYDLLLAPLMGKASALGDTSSEAIPLSERVKE